VYAKGPIIPICYSYSCENIKDVCSSVAYISTIPIVDINITEEVLCH